MNHIGEIRLKYLTNILILIIFLNGCYSPREVILANENEVKVSKIIFTDGTEIDFTNSKKGYAYISGNDVIRYLSNGEKKIYPIQTIDKIYTEEFDTPKTVIMIIGIGLGAFIAVGVYFTILFAGGT